MSSDSSDFSPMDPNSNFMSNSNSGSNNNNNNSWSPSESIRYETAISGISTPESQ